MKIETEQLRYAEDALEPAISAQTISFHHGKHLPGYVGTLTKLTAGTALQDKSVEQIYAEAAQPSPLRNNAGQVLNHNLYFGQFAAKGNRKDEPRGELRAAIERDFGSFDKMKEEMEAAATTLFGSGWAWLAANAEGRLTVGKYAGGENPVADGLTPLVCFDVWEHAYYLDYQNRRADHVKALWGIIDWAVAEARYGRR